MVISERTLMRCTLPNVLRLAAVELVKVPARTLGESDGHYHRRLTHSILRAWNRGQGAAGRMRAVNRKRKVLDHGYVTCVETWGSDQRIIESARMSTGKGFLGWEPWCDCSGPPRVEQPGRDVCERCGEKLKSGDGKLLRFLWENDHGTPFEMAGATFEVQAPLFVFREWHRHRVPFGYNEISARYTPMPDLNYVPTKDRVQQGSKKTTNKQASGSRELDDQEAQKFCDSLQVVYGLAEVAYQQALELGVPKELARLMIPVGRYSRMRATGNLRGWVGFLKLRMAPNAQWEIRQYAQNVHDVLALAFPRTLSLFDEGRK